MSSKKIYENFIKNPIKHDGLRIQINNSCDESTLEMLEILSKFKDENITITYIIKI